VINAKKLSKKIDQGNGAKQEVGATRSWSKAAEQTGSWITQKSEQARHVPKYQTTRYK